MKNHLRKALAILAIVTTTGQIHTYSYIFSNHTKREIGVGMRYYGLGEPRYFRWIPAKQARQFTPGKPTVTPTEREIEYRKIGFVGKTFWYIQGPITATQKQDPKNLAWKEFQITWLPTEAYQVAMDLYESVTAASVAAAKIALEAALAAATEGASLPVTTALETAKKGNTIKALSDLLSAVGKAASRSMMTDRHIDIIEDKGTIKFISQL